MDAAGKHARPQTFSRRGGVADLHDLHEPVDQDGPHADVDVLLDDLHVRRRRAPLQLQMYT